LLTLTSFATACASEASVTSTDAGSDRPDPVCVDGEPPDVVLKSEGGEQIGAQNSYCTGCGRCVDRFAWLQAFTYVHPGDTVTIDVPEGMLVSGGELCVAECPPRFWVLRGCSRSIQEHPAVEGEPWIVDLDPGTYTVLVGSHFEALTGLTGQLAVRFGLVVDASHERTVIDVGVVGACATDTNDDDAGIVVDAGLDAGVR
jgi:ferredoxin